MKSIRAFFAINMPKSIQNSLKKTMLLLQHNVQTPAVRWTNLQNLHITLQFLQEIQCDHLGQLIEKVRIELKNTAAFQLELGNLELFPSPRHPHVIALQAAPEDTLANIANAIGVGITSLSYPIARGQFRGHLTLGRFKYMDRKLCLLEQIKLPPIPKAEINEICLFESQLGGHHGPHYVPLEYFKLISN